VHAEGSQIRARGPASAVDRDDGVVSARSSTSCVAWLVRSSQITTGSVARAGTALGGGDRWRAIPRIRAV
jgi:hypothetical protein